MLFFFFFFLKKQNSALFLNILCHQLDFMQPWKRFQLNSKSMLFVSPQRWALTAVWLPLQEVALVLHLWDPIVFFGFLMTSSATGLSPGNEDEGPCFVTDHERLLSKWRPQDEWPLLPFFKWLTLMCREVQQNQTLQDVLLECWTYLVVNAINEKNNQEYRAHILHTQSVK